jgi:ABC-type multidrug transport system ATPase subunit
MVENSKYIAVSVSEDATDALLGCFEQPIAKTGDSIAHETPLSDEEQRDYVSRILALPDFPERLGALLAQSSELLPEITVRCDGLNVTSRAIIGTSSLPSLSNVALSVVRKATCQRSLPSKEITLVDNLSCVFRPGRSTLLLGPPGAGKSLFLSLLGDRVKSSKELKVSGNITYNGATKSDFIVQRSVGWISQEELLLPSMTVEETVNFAYQCLVPKHRRSFLAAEIGSVNDTNSKKQQDVAAVDTAAEPNTEVDTEAQGPTMSDQEFAEAIRKLAASGGKVQTVLAMLGLLRCAKTKVGSAAIRGVSGGERRRVSIAEVLVGPQAVILADQITNGLDSATTFTVIEFMTRAVRQMKRTCIAALLQPAPEVITIFLYENL